MQHVPGRRLGGVLAMMRANWDAMPGITRMQEGRRTQWGNCSPIPGDSMTCMAMSRNGCRTGRGSIRVGYCWRTLKVSYHCTNKEYPIDSTKINHTTRMAEVYVCSDVCPETSFLLICYRNDFCSMKYLKAMHRSMGCCAEETQGTQENLRRRPQ